MITIILYVTQKDSKQASKTSSICQEMEINGKREEEKNEKDIFFDDISARLIYNRPENNIQQNAV